MWKPELFSDWKTQLCWNTKIILIIFNQWYFYRYLWNQHLTDPIKDMVHHDWILDIIHGFVDQANISVYGSPILLTLVARRSSRFAGTRFLKRGANYKGKNLHNYFNLHVCPSFWRRRRPTFNFQIPAVVSQSVTNESCLICVKSEKYSFLGTTRPLGSMRWGEAELHTLKH